MKNFSKLAIDGKFTDFKNSIKSEFASRLKNNHIINEYCRQMEYYKNFAKCMSEIPTLKEYKRG